MKAHFKDLEVGQKFTCQNFAYGAYYTKIIPYKITHPIDPTKIKFCNVVSAEGVRDFVEDDRIVIVLVEED